ncbi:MAG: CDP-alcohol phosphatidyltransferase family protein [Firmicutes bacterium]|nr:CDP-alcohol phosphatidyltransferase family protein [Bacillota bacterium]
MNQRQGLLGYYNYTVILTYVGMLVGFIGIVYAFEQSIFKAVICLMVSGVCDMFDGTIASTRVRTSSEKCFGIQIDSFSDLICFGVLPAMIVYNLGGQTTLILGVCALYLLCALIRLAYFNVDEQERQQTSRSSREIYYGLPVTLSALFLPLVYGAVKLFSWRPDALPTAALMAMAILFLLPFPLRKPKMIGKTCVILCGACEIGLVVLAFDGV